MSYLVRTFAVALLLTSNMSIGSASENCPPTVTVTVELKNFSELDASLAAETDVGTVKAIVAVPGFPTEEIMIETTQALRAPVGASIRLIAADKDFGAGKGIHYEWRNDLFKPTLDPSSVDYPFAKDDPRWIEFEVSSETEGQSFTAVFANGEAANQCNACIAGTTPDSLYVNYDGFGQGQSEVAYDSSTNQNWKCSPAAINQVEYKFALQPQSNASYFNAHQCRWRNWAAEEGDSWPRSGIKGCYAVAYSAAWAAGEVGQSITLMASTNEENLDFGAPAHRGASISLAGYGQHWHYSNPFKGKAIVDCRLLPRTFTNDSGFQSQSYYFDFNATTKAHVTSESN